MRGRHIIAFFPRLGTTGIGCEERHRADKINNFFNIKFKFSIGKLIGALKPKKPSPANVGTHGDRNPEL